MDCIISIPNYTITSKEKSPEMALIEKMSAFFI